MGSEFFQQLGAAFYQWTSFQVGSFNLADFGSNMQSAFLSSSFVSTLQVISALITIVLGLATIYLLMKRKELDQLEAVQIARVETSELGPVQSQWNDILRHIDSPREGEWKFAIIEADTLTDIVLKNYFPGDTMGDRLMNIDKTKLQSLDGLWEAHKVRNRLAHEPNYFLRHAEANRAIKLFEATLKELRAIQ